MELVLYNYENGLQTFFKTQKGVPLLLVRKDERYDAYRLQKNSTNTLYYSTAVKGKGEMSTWLFELEEKPLAQ